MHRFEKSSFEKYSVYTLTKIPIQCISPKFFTFFKGLQPCLSCRKPNENFVNNYCQLLNKDIFNPGNFCICFLMTETIITCTWICSLKKLIFILQELQLYTCRYSCTNIYIFFFIRALCSHLFTLSANAWTPLSLTLLQLASTDFSH